MGRSSWFRVDQHPAEALASSYATAAPFAHAVVDGLVEPSAAEELAEAFPPIDWPGWETFEDSYQPEKRYCEDVRSMPGLLADVIREANEPHMLEWLSTLTGIPALLPDPYLIGGGLHQTGPGGLLRPHTDFHHHRLGLFRRVNVLLYLNRAWPEGAGGQLCLFRHDDPHTPVERIEPVLGRVVVFTTDDKSVHGFPEPVAIGHVRRSVALYYYTATEATASFAGDSNTFWRTHDESPNKVHATRMLAYRAFLRASRAMSYVAHRVHPDFRKVTRRWR